MLSEEQRLNAILYLEGMPPELPLLVDSPDCIEPEHEPEESELNAQEHVQAALNIDPCTAVDVFMAAQHEHEYRWKDDAKPDEQ